MRIMHTIALASFAGALALSGAAFAAGTTISGGTSSTTGTQGGIQDETGMTTLGVDIRGVDPSNVESFMAGIPAESQASVKKGCENVVTHQENQNAAVLSFCQALTKNM